MGNHGRDSRCSKHLDKNLQDAIHLEHAKQMNSSRHLLVILRMGRPGEESGRSLAGGAVGSWGKGGVGGAAGSVSLIVADGPVLWQPRERSLFGDLQRNTEKKLAWKVFHC